VEGIKVTDFQKTSNCRICGIWQPGDLPPQTDIDAVKTAIRHVNRPVAMIEIDGRSGVGEGGRICIGAAPELESKADHYPLLVYIPPLPPEALGDSHFKTAFNLRYAYVVGAMANGITSVDMVAAAGDAGLLGFFGAAGLSIGAIEAAIGQLQARLGDRPFGFNLIHSPNEPDHEAQTVDLYLKKGIRLVSASAYLDLTLPIVYYRVKGIYRDSDGKIVCPNRIVAKVSRIEVARKFLAPPADKFLNQLQEEGKISSAEATLSRQIPMADAISAEADSGGHTDNQPALALLPTMLALRDKMVANFNYNRPIWVGLGGGIATPGAAAAAFAMGAAYVLTGSVNQACVEAGTSETVRHMLVEASQADVTMAPAADMFEMGVKVQVLNRGTMFAFRAAKLYELYNRCNSLNDIPAQDRQVLERDFFRCSLEQVWDDTRNFFLERDPRQIERAEKDPKHLMALVFRSYLGQSSNWANSGEHSRKIDYQIWCGPAMGAFNEWAAGSVLEKPENRSVVTVAMNLLMGAAVIARYNWLQIQGINLPREAGKYTALPLDQIRALLV